MTDWKKTPEYILSSTSTYDDETMRALGRDLIISFRNALREVINQRVHLEVECQNLRANASTVGFSTERVAQFDDVEELFNELLTPEERAENQREAEKELAEVKVRRARRALSMRERFQGQVTKDKWIQMAKALFFDCGFSLDSKCLEQEAQELIDIGGGYDYETETSTSPLIWPQD
jgi:hypothetical protein